MAGWTESFGAGIRDSWLVKTDAFGIVLEFSSHTILGVFLVVASSVMILIYRNRAIDSKAVAKLWRSKKVFMSE